MCKHGDDVIMTVPVPAELAHDGKLRWADRAIDRCIASLVAALNAHGVYTANSCCGHGKGRGSIILHDGRELVLQVST